MLIQWLARSRDSLDLGFGFFLSPIIQQQIERVELVLNEHLALFLGQCTGN